MLPVQASLQEAFTTTPISSLSTFDRLPYEILWQILHSLDLISLLRFRQVNQRARELSTAMPEYQHVANHGLEGLRGLLRGGLGTKFTIVDLYIPLITPECTVCGDFGRFLFLCTATRCCWTCLRKSPEFRVIPPSSFDEHAGIYAELLHEIVGPFLRTVPGKYCVLPRSPVRPEFLLPKHHAVDQLTALGILDPEPRKLILERTLNFHFEYTWMATIVFPWYNQRTAQADAGVNCKGCKIRLARTDEDRDTAFSVPGFLSHFESCVEAQNLWEESRRRTQTGTET